MAKLTPKGLQASRALLELNIDEIAGMAKCSYQTVIRYERGEKIRESIIEAIHAAILTARLEVDGQTWCIELLNGKSLGGARLIKSNK